MKYIVIELQTNGESVSNIVTQHDTYKDAMNKYHNILAFAYSTANAADKMSAIVLDDYGSLVESSYVLKSTNLNTAIE